MAPPTDNPVTYLRRWPRRVVAGVNAPQGCFRGDAAHDPGENCRFALSAELMDGPEPVPAALRVVRCGLLRIHHDEAVLVGESAEPCAGGELQGVLGAPVQGKEQRGPSGPAQAEGDVHPVAPEAGRPGEPVGKPGATSGWPCGRLLDDLADDLGAALRGA